MGYSQVNLMGLVACQAAYEKGGPWLGRMKEYLAGNLVLVREYMREHLPEIGMVEPEGTYLLWLEGAFMAGQRSNVWRGRRRIRAS